MKNFLQNNLQLITVSAGHFTNDFYIALIPPILFAFKNAMGLSLAQQSMISFIIITFGSLFQPLVGLFLDKSGKSSLLMLSIIWISFMMSISGLAGNYYILLMIVALASISSSIYHPLGSSITVNLSKDSRGKSLSIFMTVGTFAATFAPMIAIPIVTKFGLKYIALLMIPGFIIAYFLKLSKIDKLKFRNVDKDKKDDKKRISKDKTKWLSILVIMSSIITIFKRMIIIFGIQLMVIKGIGIIPAGIILSVHLFMRALGTLSGGYMSDKFGEGRIIVFYNLLLFAIYTAMIFSKGIWMAGFMILLGYILNGTNTANVTISHHILPNDINFGTGTIMGLPGTIGSVLLLAFGKLADIYGLLEVAQLTALVGLLPIFISLYIYFGFEKKIKKTVFAH